MKGEETRKRVIQKAAGLFNRHGYRATSVSDVMEATGLQKGGIYRHFESKEALGLLAFDYAVEKMTERFEAALLGQESALERLLAIVSVYLRIPHDPPVPGGCPLLNAAVESDDADPALRRRAADVLTRLVAFLATTIERGQERGEIDLSVQAQHVAIVVVSQLEGGVMMAKVHRDQAFMDEVVAHLRGYLAGLCAPAAHGRRRRTREKHPGRRPARPTRRTRS